MKAYFGLLATLLSASFLLPTAFAEETAPWAFAVIADNRDRYDCYRRVLEEIRDRRTNPRPAMPPADFVVACGDLDPLVANHVIYKEVFSHVPDAPLYVPVMGNHDAEKAADRNYLIDRLLPAIAPWTTRAGTNNADYCFDWKNTRLIAVDLYDGRRRLWLGPWHRRWVEESILSATNASHVFIAVHEPAFPRHRYERPGLDQSGIETWKMLTDNLNRVRVLFCGHTHNYYRMCVRDPLTGARGYPQQPGGLWQIDVGNAGHNWESDGFQTIVWVEVRRNDVRVRVVQAPDGTADFHIRDEWIIAPPPSTGIPQTTSAGSEPTIHERTPAMSGAPPPPS